MRDCAKRLDTVSQFDLEQYEKDSYLHYRVLSSLHFLPPNTQ